ncbi:YheC/YheD family endospore coat-associated protein [Paenibacillus harenae]|uniref:YheC/YheD family endospore coat-associated protein n=1 Tax=Paenibacillus harenae TaxID=306543 RepID=UPI0027925D6C|nr:YheC/YheD family protein [Paenibacillus harenae]MDQ0062810.1 glutathione synthase/RimK-type ligase-like ATP-grasp enzyme [Paenibacillus harenae]
MNSTKVTLRINQDEPGASASSPSLLLSEEHAKRWNIPYRTPLTLSFGSARQEITVEPSTEGSFLQIDAKLAAKWGAKHEQLLSFVYKNSTKTIQLGPLIGVIVSRVNRNSSEMPFGTNTSFCYELSELCKSYGASIFFFTKEDVMSQSDSIKGWHYTDSWVRGRFPVPHIIYNRITSRRKERLPGVQQFVRYAKKRHNAVFFNEKYLNKTEVFEALKKEASLKPYLPESYPLRGSKMLKTMCSKYEVVFIKPINGSLGKGIVKVYRGGGPEQGYTSHVNNVTGIRAQTFSTLDKLYGSIAAKLKRSQHQIQRGLKLLSVNGRPIDFRALVQRGETGQWTITSIVARIAENNQFVSNVARGGTISTVKAALARTGSSAAAGGLSKLRRVSLLIAKGIDSQIPGHFAELGIDLAIDTQGRVWLIEVNAKPSKEDSSPLDQSGKARPSVKKFVQYAYFASGFNG